jgi:hypothetical protein
MRTSRPHAARALAAAAAALSLAGACGSPSLATGPLAELESRVVFSGTPAPTRVRLTVAPQGIDADLTRDPASGAFGGTFAVQPAVAQTFTATAYAGTAEVGSGTASATVQPGASAVVAITIRDGSGRPAGADHGPIVASVSASTTTPASGEYVALATSARDPDGDGVTYLWSDDCEGTYSTPRSATTQWRSTLDAARPCTITVTASSRTLSASRSLTLAAPAAGEACADPGTFDCTASFSDCQLCGWEVTGSPSVELRNAVCYVWDRRVGEGLLARYAGANRFFCGPELG